jgi:uncharacterized membrane protein YhiD involved in acid resistance
MWTTAGFGVAVGLNQYEIAFKGTIIALIGMTLLARVHEVLEKYSAEAD